MSVSRTENSSMFFVCVSYDSRCIDNNPRCSFLKCNIATSQTPLSNIYNICPLHYIFKVFHLHVLHDCVSPSLLQTLINVAKLYVTCRGKYDINELLRMLNHY